VQIGKGDLMLKEELAEVKQLLLKLEAKIDQPLAVTIVSILGWKWVDIDLAEHMIPYLEQRHMGVDYWKHIDRKTAREDCVKVFPKRNLYG
jgi:hypothetical protein